MILFYSGSAVSLLASVIAAWLFGGSYLLIGLFGPLFFWGVGGLNIVNEWDRRPVMRLGKYARTLEKGISWIDPITHWTLDDVPVRDVVDQIQIKSVQTKDNVPLGFLLVITRKVTDPQKAVTLVEDYEDAIEQRALGATNETIGGHDLSEILENRTAFETKILESVKKKVEGWGVEVNGAEIKDFRILDTSIEQALAMKARAKKEAEAELARANAQFEIVQALNKAADELSDKGWTLKKLETLIEMTRSANNNTVLIPTELTDMLGSVSKLFGVGGSASIAA